MSDQVLVGMASIPEREQSMRRAVESLAPQADRVVVALNEYDHVPGFLAKHQNVEPVLLDGAKGDGAKFHAVDDWDGFVVTTDDDILYPPDYVRTLVAGIERHGRRYAAGFHGGTTLGWNGQNVAASHKRVRCLGDLEQDDTDVNVLGTGAMGYHAAHFPVWAGVFRHANMADDLMACHARTMGVPFVALAHQAGWLQDICPPVNQGRRIYDSNRNGDGTACDTRLLRQAEIRRFDWLVDPPPRPRVHVAIGTCGRPDLLRQLLDDLTRESQWVDLRVSVYEDPTGEDYGLPQRMCRRARWPWTAFPKRLGREGYWRLVDRQLRDAKRSDADWFVFLPDDVRLVRHAIPRAIATWYRLDDPTTLTLWRLRSLEGMKNWTNKDPVEHLDATETFHVDGCYLARRDALAYLGFRLPPTRLTGTGSGVGRYMSKRLDSFGARMYRVPESLVTDNDGGVSVMNPAERVRHPALALNHASVIQERDPEEAVA